MVVVMVSLWSRGLVDMAFNECSKLPIAESFWTDVWNHCIFAEAFAYRLKLLLRHNLHT